MGDTIRVYFFVLLLGALTAVILRNGSFPFYRSTFQVVEPDYSRRLSDNTQGAIIHHRHHYNVLEPGVKVHHNEELVGKDKVKVVVIIPTEYGNVLQRANINKQFEKEGWNKSVVRIFWVVGNKLLEKSSYEKRKDTPIDILSIYSEPYMSKQNVITTPCFDLEEVEQQPLPKMKASSNRNRGSKIQANPIPPTMPLVSNATATVPQSPATTCKLYWAMRYLHHHFDAEYAIRSSDTAYLNIRKFLEIESTLPRSAVWLGRAADDDHLALSASPTYCDLTTRTLFGLDHLSRNYMMGMGYVVSWDVVKLIGGWNIQPHIVTPDIGRRGNDDVMLGMYLSMFQIQRIHRPDLFAFLPSTISDPQQTSSVHENQNIILLQFMESSDWDKLTTLT